VSTPDTTTISEDIGEQRSEHIEAQAAETLRVLEELFAKNLRDHPEQ